ncbi:DUF6029 family protein [Flavobacterium sp. XGLA_31]|uniref:DUF6029 family protein n=1 Tax=Flavobacterium sp. XGLA_31 TaxID=3447666 RepID=UPI003F3B6D12
MKRIIVMGLLGLSAAAFAQEKEKDKGTFSGGFETNAQWYLNDKCLFDEFHNPVVHPEDPLRSNSYLFVNYKIKNWTFGIQAEAYEQQALLNYNPKYENANVATYFAQFKNEKIDVTAGYYYEQFGSGLLLRTWEDRALGINNALRGLRFIYKPTKYFTLKTLYGQMRTGFDVSEGKIFGADAELTLSDVFKFEKDELAIGFTYVGRDEKTAVANPNFNQLTNAFAGRINYSHNGYYVSSEYDYKGKDAVVQVKNQIDNNLIKPGSAFLLNMGYSKKGFGLDATFRRLENMSFYAERLAKGNQYNDLIMNYVPSLTKQHHYNLANIYVYQAQPNVIINDVNLVKAGEIGGQIDLFYNFKKGTALGGKYGTKVALNYAEYHGLGGDFYIYSPQDYHTDFIGFGEKYFTDANIEITKKWNEKWQSGFSYINQYYNKKYIQETYGEVKSNIVGAETTCKFNNNNSVRVQAEHLWANSDKRNWASLLTEFNFGTKYSMYVSDMYNYGNEDAKLQHHYYSVGSAYRYKSTRIALAYGRQRGGLVCVGGVCRYVPESTGVSLSLNTSF